MSLLSCADALATVAAKMLEISPLACEQVLLDAARGRVLARAITADRDQPPFPRSTRDGYAVRSGNAAFPLRLIGSLRAGEAWTGDPLGPGQTIEIMTGAPVPAGADAVVMLEHVSLEDGVLRIAESKQPRAGENIVPRGAEAHMGDELLQPGVKLGPAQIALAASVGAHTLEVYRRPVAAVLATGDELVGVHQQPGGHQIRNSNSHALAALVEENGGVARMLPPAADTRESLLAAFAAARDAGILLLSGGVSAGKYDLVEDVLLSLGAEFFFTGVSMQPGKPALFGWIPPTGAQGSLWIFGLPGNPVSTQVTALLFAMPMLRALGGEAAPSPRFAQASLAKEVTVRPGLTRFLPALLTGSIHGATVATTGWQGSGDLNANARANGYLVVPPEVSRMEAGSPATVLLR